MATTRERGCREEGGQGRDATAFSLRDHLRSRGERARLQYEIERRQQARRHVKAGPTTQGTGEEEEEDWRRHLGGVNEQEARRKNKERQTTYLNNVDDDDDDDDDDDNAAVYEMARQFASQLPPQELSMAKISGFLMQYRHPQDALDHLPSLLSHSVHALQRQGSARPLLSSTSFRLHIPIYEHLRRLGLQHFSALFELHGIYYRHDLGGSFVKDETWRNWAWELRHHPRVVQRMTRLLSHSASFFSGPSFSSSSNDFSDYQLATVASIREMLRVTFPPERVVLVGVPGHYLSPSREKRSAIAFSREGSTDHSIPIFRRLADYERSWYRFEEDTLPSGRIALLLTRFSHLLIQTVTRAGVPRISNWQLRFLLTHHDRSDDLLAAASVAVASRSPSSFQPTPLTTLQWCKWAGVDRQYAEALSVHCPLANNLARVGKDDHYIYTILAAVVDEAEDEKDNKVLQEMIKLIKGKPMDVVRSSAIIPVEKGRARTLFTAFYSRGEMGLGKEARQASSDVVLKTKKKKKKEVEGEEEKDGIIVSQGTKPSSRCAVARHERKKEHRLSLGELASFFAREVSDVLGHGRVSFLEIQRYLGTHQGDPEAAVREVATLVLPTSPPSCDFVHDK